MAGAPLMLGVGFGKSALAKQSRIKVLIIDGVSNHNWALTTKLVRAILIPTGLFDVSVSTSPPSTDAPGWDVWRPDFKAHDVIVQTYNDLGGRPTWPDAVKADFESYVRRGGGVYVLHSGNNSFAGWPAYNEIIGLGWRTKDYGKAVYIDEAGRQRVLPSGEGGNTGHGPRADAIVHRLGDHPVHEGFPRAWMTADVELYRYARGPAHNLNVLSYAFEPVTRMNWPMEWAVKYGSGRVYVANYGHVWKGDLQPVTMRSVDVQTILIRALQWLAKRTINYPVPADFPTVTATSVRPELPLV